MDHLKLAQCINQTKQQPKTKEIKQQRNSRRKLRGYFFLLLSETKSKYYHIQE